MSSRKQCRNRFYSRNPQTSFTTLRCPAERGTRLTRPDEKHMWEACCVQTIYSTNSADFGHSAWNIKTRRTTSCRYIWSEPCILLIYCRQLHWVYGHFCCSVRCTFAGRFNKLRTAFKSLRTLICNTFDRRSYKFPGEHLSLLLEWFTPFLTLLFLLYSILVSSFYLSVNIFVFRPWSMVTCNEIWSVRSLGRIKSSRSMTFQRR